MWCYHSLTAPSFIGSTTCRLTVSLLRHAPSLTPCRAPASVLLRSKSNDAVSTRPILILLYHVSDPLNEHRQLSATRSQLKQRLYIMFDHELPLTNASTLAPRLALTAGNTTTRLIAQGLWRLGLSVVASSSVAALPDAQSAQAGRYVPLLMPHFALETTYDETFSGNVP